MSFLETISTAISNTFRNRLRAVLTILAIFVGAFTLTITNGIGTGVSNYISTQVSSMGADDVMFISMASLSEGPFPGAGEGPVEYDPDRTVMSAMGGMQLEAMTSADIEQIEAIDGVLEVEAMKMVTVDYIRHADGTRYELLVNASAPGANLDLLAGTTFTAGTGEREILLPGSFVQALGFSSPAEAVGQEVALGVSGVLGSQSEVTATVIGVQEQTLFEFGAMINPALTDALYEEMTSGLPPALTDMVLGVTAWFDPALGPAHVAQIKSELSEQGYLGQTVADQLGQIQTVITAITGVLSAFAVIALIAAGFGIINTLYMSVQERTREIGLMKALGMGAGSIFALFSAEAAFIGFLGSAIGSAAAIGLGVGVSNWLAAGPLSDLPGFRVIAFDPLSVLLVIVIVMVLAFLAGTLPAARAARLDPIDALRYE